MQQFRDGTNTILPPVATDGLDQLADTTFNLEEVLPLSAIREHTKTDDVPSVTDFQLRLYRKAAFESAQEYTGLLLMGQKVVTESVPLPPVHGIQREDQMFMRVRLKHSPAEPFVWFYGLKGARPQRVPVLPGVRDVRLPRLHDDFGMGCCNPCGDANTARVQYVAGMKCVGDMPATVLLGALKYIAHVVENPGDLVVAASVSGGTRSSGVSVNESSDPAWASGAINIWRVLVKDAI